MFSVADRSAIQAGLVARAESDERVVGAALVGSAARGSQDDWSDIDLALQLDDGVEETAVVADWTQAIDEAYGISDIHDVWADARYRVFLLASSLQVDVSFWPRDRFRATEPGFLVLFGTPNPATMPPEADTSGAIGMGWLYAIHARSAIARGRLWQAALMLDGLRNNVLALKCSRVGLNGWHGREVDLLPAEETAAVEATLAAQLSAHALDDSRVALTSLLLEEVAMFDPDRARRLEPAFAELAMPLG